MSKHATLSPKPRRPSPRNRELIEAYSALRRNRRGAERPRWRFLPRDTHFVWHMKRQGSQALHGTALARGASLRSSAELNQYDATNSTSSDKSTILTLTKTEPGEALLLAHHTLRSKSANRTVIAGGPSLRYHDTS